MTRTIGELDDLRRALSIIEQNLRRAEMTLSLVMKDIEKRYYEECKEFEINASTTTAKGNICKPYWKAGRIVLDGGKKERVEIIDNRRWRPPVDQTKTNA